MAMGMDWKKLLLTGVGLGIGTAFGTLIGSMILTKIQQKTA